MIDVLMNLPLGVFLAGGLMLVLVIVAWVHLSLSRRSDEHLLEGVPVVIGGHDSKYDK